MPSSVINSDNGAISGSSGLKTTGGDDGLLNIQSNGTNVVEVSSGVVAVKGTSSGGAAVRLYEDTDNGTNYVGLSSPASIASNYTLTLPSADGTSGQVLQTNGSGALSFGSVGDAVGSMQYFGVAGSPPAGYPDSTYLKCDGSIVSQSTYSTLYSRLGLIIDFPITSRTSGTSSDIYALTYGNSLYVYAGAGGVLRTSTDGITWTARTSGTSSNINALTYGGVYVYAGDGGVLRTSTDAVTWTSRTSGTTSQIKSLTYGNGIYVYGGDGGVLRTSTDGITWTSRTSGTTNRIDALTYGNGLYVLGAVGGEIRTSTDGITWTSRTSGADVTITALVYTGSLFAYGSFDGLVATSTDGITWTPKKVTSLTQIYALTYGNNVYVVAGASGQVAISTDNVTWSTAISPSTSTIYALTFGNNKYVTGGTGGTVLTASKYSYNTATEFVVPNQLSFPAYYSTGILYIKAT